MKNKFNILYEQIMAKLIFQSDLSIQNLIELIKQRLLVKYHKNNWEDFINSQKFGDCKKIASYVAKLVQNCEMIQVQQNYTNQAINDMEKLNYIDPKTKQPYIQGNHFLNMINNKLYDFGKGTNSIDQTRNVFNW